MGELNMLRTLLIRAILPPIITCLMCFIIVVLFPNLSVNLFIALWIVIYLLTQFVLLKE